MRFLILLATFMLVSCTSIKEGSSQGGVVWEHFSDKSYSKVVRLASEHCRSFGKSAEIYDKKINGFIESEYDEYKFRCVDNQQKLLTNPVPQPFNPGGSTFVPSPRVSLDDAAQKCSSLGFKAGTEAFGNCVLKISR